MPTPWDVPGADDADRSMRLAGHLDLLRDATRST
jgi:hypothetical protein